MSKTKFEVNIDDIVLKRTISAAILNLNQVELHLKCQYRQYRTQYDNVDIAIYGDYLYYKDLLSNMYPFLYLKLTKYFVGLSPWFINYEMVLLLITMSRYLKH